ncbi:MAG TPA: DUF4235 domain-containing protein [Actinomycetes bacterium]|nr:DUF4235 domain-containing protein [Actinomycetes bacterium]
MADEGRVEAVMLTAAGLAAAAVARKVVDVVWVAVSGQHAPQADDPDETIPRAVTGALITGALLSLIHMVVSRKTHEITRARRARA